MWRVGQESAGGGGSQQIYLDMAAIVQVYTRTATAVSKTGRVQTAKALGGITCTEKCCAADRDGRYHQGYNEQNEELDVKLRVSDNKEELVLEKKVYVDELGQNLGILRLGEQQSSPTSEKDCSIATAKEVMECVNPCEDEKGGKASCENSKWFYQLRQIFSGSRADSLQIFIC